MASAIQQVLSAMKATIDLADLADLAAYRRGLNESPKNCSACWAIRRATPGSQFQSSPCGQCGARNAEIEIERLRAQWRAKQQAHAELRSLKTLGFGSVTERRIDQELRALEKSMDLLIRLAHQTKWNGEEEIRS